jgi:hypothetical protein
MAKKPLTPKKRNSNSLRNQLFAISAFALVVKFAIISRIQGFDWFAAGNGNVVSGLQLMLDKSYAPARVWYGADAENYLRSVVGLFRDGFFSTETNLHYWPAGYPTLIWLVGIVFQGSMLAMVAILQSVLYFLACAFFVNEIRQSRLVNFSWPIALVLTFNPTLALNTIAIGYELPTASFSLIAIAALMRKYRTENRKIIDANLVIASLSFALSTFMQPRLAILAFACLLIWVISKFPLKSAVAGLAFSMAIVLIGPAVMMFRNSQARGFTAISTNLGATMNIGAGDKATGGYTNSATGVKCPEVSGNEAQKDSARVKCVLQWYASNPSKFLKLSMNKAIYYWSPWFGPVANGTMARNPWRINHPLNETVKTQSGAEMVFGNTGKLISWTWLIAGIGLLFWGTRFLWRAGGIERLWGISAFSLVILNWLSSIATIGDHRFRIPTMTLSVVLQTIGLVSLLISKRKKLVGPSINVTWPGLHWKGRDETDNLQP